MTRTERLILVTIGIETSGGQSTTRFVGAGEILFTTDGEEFFPYRGDPLISATGTEYDDAGRFVASTDARGFITRNEYDAAGRRTNVINALGQATGDYSAKLVALMRR